MTVIQQLADEANTSPKRRRNIGRWIGGIIFGLIAAVVVVALVVAGVVVYNVQRSFPQRDGEITVEGLDAPVQIVRDSLGIPTVMADSTHDLLFAQGYVHAQDRFWEMDFRRHVTSGRLSELFGESQLGTDKFIRTLGWRDVAEREVEALDEETLARYEAYADGINAYLAENSGADASLEYAVLGLQNAEYTIEPWTPADSVAWMKAMAWDLRSNLEDEAERALLASSFDASQLAELYPSYPYDTNPVIVPTLTAAENPTDTVAPVLAPVRWTEVTDVVAAASTLVSGAGEGIGSNSWVVSGDLTESGLPLLANDPHLGSNLPSVWHQIGLVCSEVSAECPFDVSGFSFSGVPGVVIGHNAQIAWGFTNLTTDVADLYVEVLDGENYWRDGALVPLDVRTETIKVAGGKNVELEIRSTIHGPIVSGLSDDFAAIAADPSSISEGFADAPAGEFALSLQWTALTPGNTPSAIFAMNTATNFAEFREAARLFEVPAQNLVYADIDGNIGYQTPGSLPIRGASDGSMPSFGWDSSYDWSGTIPFEELPTLYNPPEGFIVTANNALVDNYPYPLTTDWDYGWRAARITEMLERAIAAGPLTVETMRRIQADNEFWLGKRLITAYASVSVDDPQTAATLALLEDWDAQNSANSAAAAYANVLWDELARNLFSRRDTPSVLGSHDRMFVVVDRLLDDPASTWWVNPKIDVASMEEMLAKSATDAEARLSKLQGDDPTRWNWGKLHALPLRSDTFGTSGIAPIEWLFNRGPYPVGGGSSVVNATGWSLGGTFATSTVPSMRMVIDLADFDKSGWNNLTGTSGHAFHENYVDQVATWQQAQLTPWAFSEEAVRKAAVHTLVLTP